MNKAFYDTIRPMFGGKLKQSQIDGIDRILAAGSGLLRTQVAYILATAFHETAHTMDPITERGQRSYFDKYEPSTKIGKSLGNTRTGDGYLYRGRGYVQITGRANYAKAGDKLGLKLVDSPDLALDAHIAAQIMVRGMLEGWFTGKKLADYITASKTDYAGARRIVNGTDRASLIAEYAVTFDAALRANKDETDKPKAAPTGIFHAIMEIIKGLWK